jgi:acetyl esterase/lipase
MRSLSFHVVMAMIRRRKVRQLFAHGAADVTRLRAGNIHSPVGKDVLHLATRSFRVGDSVVTELRPVTVTCRDVILYCPGGYLVSGPAPFNWTSIATLVKKTGSVAYLIDHPKAPEHDIDAINASLDAVYWHMSTQHPTGHIVLLGGSVGGALMTLLVQRLLATGRPLPKALVLITPVMECSLTHTAIAAIEPRDVFHVRQGVAATYASCAGKIDPASATMSPSRGTTAGFIPTLALIAEDDIHRPDAELFIERLRQSGASPQVIHGAGMPHIWPLLPMMREARAALDQIAAHLVAIGRPTDAAINPTGAGFK